MDVQINLSKNILLYIRHHCSSAAAATPSRGWGPAGAAAGSRWRRTAPRRSLSSPSWRARAAPAGQPAAEDTQDKCELFVSSLYLSFKAPSRSAKTQSLT